MGLTLKLDSMYSPYLDELDKHLLAKELTLSEQSLKKKHKKWWDPTGPILAKLSALSTSFGDCYRLRVKKKMLANSGVQFIVREVTLAGKARPQVYFDGKKSLGSHSLRLRFFYPFLCV